MKCDRCSNYQVSMSGTNDGYYTACREYFHSTAIISPMTREYKQEVMDGKRKYCKGYEKI
jgi:hypothetical protein